MKGDYISFVQSHFFFSSADAFNMDQYEILSFDKECQCMCKIINP